MTQFHDFDAAWAEEDDEPIVVKVLGREWACKRPSEVPAALLLKLDRLMLLAAADEVPDDFVIDDSLSPESILRQLAGGANVDAWLAGVEQDDGTSKRLPYTRLAEVSQYLNARYRGQDPGEAPAANREQRRAAAKPKKKQGSGSGRS